MKSQIVVISGKQGSGKTTLQARILNNYRKRPNTKLYLLNFADALYAMHNFCLGYLKQYGIERDLVKDGPLLQLLGTEWGRNTIDQNIWVKLLQKRIDEIIEREGMDWDKCVFVIGDCRFKNELDGLPGALRVRLECDRETRKTRCSQWRENDMHPSEIDLDEWVNIPGKFDMIFNTGTQGVEHCGSMIMAQLDKDTWAEKR